MKPSGDEAVDGEKAQEAAAKLTLEDQLNEIGQAMLESAKRQATDPEHRARIQKLLV